MSVYFKITPWHLYLVPSPHIMRKTNNTRYQYSNLHTDQFHSIDTWCKIDRTKSYIFKKLKIKFSNSNVLTGLLHTRSKWTISELIREVLKIYSNAAFLFAFPIKELKLAKTTTEKSNKDNKISNHIHSKFIKTF